VKTSLSLVAKEMPMDIAKWIVAFVALHGFGGFVADAIVPSTARQHLSNPAWPPHAKFHNAQTMLIGIFGGSLSLFVLFGFQPLTMPLFLVATGLASTAGSQIILLILCFCSVGRLGPSRANRLLRWIC
jgi:hypothetical protein